MRESERLGGEIRVVSCRYVTYTLYEGQSIIQICQHKKIVKKVYPLHDKEALKKLGRMWYLAIFNKQPFGTFGKLES